MSPGAERTLLDTIETQRLGCELSGSPLYAALLDVVADDVRRAGPLADLLEPVADAPFGDAVLLRFLGGIHRLVLDGEAPEIAERFPSVGGERPTVVDGRGRPDATLREELLAVAVRSADRLAADLALPVQTNEVGRSAALLGGHLEVARAGLPLRVLEIGASAGLNLLFDRYRYVGGGGAFGPIDSPLRFVEPWFGATPALGRPLEVAVRRGCDRYPIDPTTPAGRTRLRSFVWPDMPERLARLDAALEVAAESPPTVERARAGDWVEAELARPTPGLATVLTHSIVLQYVAPDERRRLIAAIDGAGRRASPEAPFAWLRLEPGGDQAELRLTTWPGGEVRVLARSSYHGPPVVWQG